jgi:hypothetical protein
VRIFIQRKCDRSVWGRGGVWSQDPSEALPFWTTQKAFNLCHEFRLEGCEVIVDGIAGRNPLRLQTEAPPRI